MNLNELKRKAFGKKGSASINEASEVDFSELDPKIVTFLQKHGLDKLDAPNTPKRIKTFFWDGIHGVIMSFMNYNTNTRDESVRFDKEDLKKVINDDQFRWVDVHSIGVKG